MVIVIGNLPRKATEGDLCQRIGLAPGVPVRIVKKSSVNGGIQRFALVSVASEARARRLVDRVNGTDWRGQILLAREYRHRTGANERRRVDWRARRWRGDERRLDERRSFAQDMRSFAA